MPNEDIYHEEETYVPVEEVRQVAVHCRLHATHVLGKLSDRLKRAVPGTPCGVDKAAARAGAHTMAFAKRLEAIEALSNTVVVHLSSLETLLKHETLYTLSMVPLVRSLAEAAATARWLIEPGITADERNARAYASAFNTLARHKAILPRADVARDELKALIKKNGGRVHNRYENTERSGDFVTPSGETIRRKYFDRTATDEVGSVRVGSRTESTAFKYSQRLKDQIPSISGLYPQMSVMTHGDDTAVPVAWDNPAPVLRMAAFVMRDSTEAWSEGVHDWIGATHEAPVVRAELWEAVLRSMPVAQRARLEAERDQLRAQQDLPIESARGGDGSAFRWDAWY